MKKLSTFLAAFGLLYAHGQTACDDGRFASDVFPNITVTSNIVYGQNTSWSGANTTLYVDFYEPQNDVMEARPLIIWVHGGSFLGGSRTDADMVALSTSFAKKGFTCASISYRTGFFPIDSTNSVKAVVRAVQDMKGAIRFFYKDAATDNNYKIDTTRIFIGGSSAGAITALHVAYLTEECELINYLNSSQQAALGGLEGTSGNPGYSTKVRGVLNGAGALAQYSWLDSSNSDIPLASVHGTSDNVVTYNRGLVNPGVALMYLDGSRMLHERACALDIENQLYTFHGAGHVPYLGSTPAAIAYMDTTINFYRDFLVKQLGCTNSALQPANPWAQTATLYNASYCDGSPVNEVCALSGIDAIENEQFSIFPNPASNLVKIQLSENSTYSMTLIDISGRTILSTEFSNSTTEFDVAALTPGSYFVQVISLSSGYSQMQKLIVQ